MVRALSQSRVAAYLTNSGRLAVSVPSSAPGLHQLAALSIGRQQIQSWLVDLSAYPLPAWQNCLSLLERQRAIRLVFDKDRKRFQAAHSALRDLLARRLHCQASSFEFQTTAQGKPYLAAGSSSPYPCHFNLSHSENLALVGICDDIELGVDIEVLREVGDLWSLAGEVFSYQEQSELRETSPDQRDSAFLRGWTRKEACLKAAGCGLSIAPRTFHVGLAVDQAQVSLNTDNGEFHIHVQTIDVGSSAIAAVAWINDNPDLNPTAA